MLRLKFATVSAVSGSVCKGQVSWRARNDTIMCRLLRVQIRSVCFEFRGEWICMPGKVSGGRIAKMFRFCFCNVCIGEGSSTQRAGVVYEFRSEWIRMPGGGVRRARYDTIMLRLSVFYESRDPMPATGVREGTIRYLCV